MGLVVAGFAIAGITKGICDSNNREEAARTERCVREEQERVEREKRLAIEIAKCQRQMAIDKIRINQNLVQCKDLDAKRTMECQRFCTAAQQIFAERDMRIAEIIKQQNAFVSRQQELHMNKSLDLQQRLIMRLDAQNREGDAMDRIIAEQRARLEKKRIDIENAKKVEALKKELWNALCKTLANGEINLLVNLPPEMLEMLEPQHLEMLNHFYGGGKTNVGEEQIKEEFRKILIQSALMLRAILDKFGLKSQPTKPSNGKDSTVAKELRIDVQKAMEMGTNDLFFVLSNGGEMFSKVLVEADHLDVAEFIAALCNYASMTELPQLIVPDIVLQFSKPFIKQLPNMVRRYRKIAKYRSKTKKEFEEIKLFCLAHLMDIVAAEFWAKNAADCSAFHCEKTGGNTIQYVAKNSVIHSFKCVAEMTTNSGQHPTKLANFHLMIINQQ